MLKFGAVWGLDIGDSALKAVKLKRVGKGIALLDFHVVRYADLGGEPGARREGMLPQAITALQNAGLGHERCIVSIAPQMVFNRFISLPPVDKRRIPEIVLYEAKQQIPFNLSEVVWAYEPIRKDFIPGEEIEIGLFAAKREVIDGYLNELAPLKRQLHGVQVSPLALYNFIRNEVAVEKPTVVIDVGAQSTNLLILDGERFWLRNLPIAGNSFTSMLEKRLNIPRAEAEKLKYTVAESRHRRRLLEVLRPVMRDLVAEIQRSVGYYKSLSQQVKFEEILVTGEGYKLFGLDRFLAEQLQYTITPVHDLKNIAYQGDPARLKELQANLPSLGVAVGLALQGLGASRATINLLPEDFVVQRELQSKRFSGLIAAGLIWAIVGCFWLSEKNALAKLAEMEDKGTSTLAELAKRDKEFGEAQQGRGADPTIINFQRHREYYARVIGAISAVIPREFQVDGFKVWDANAISSTGGPAPANPRSEAARGPGAGPVAGQPPPSAEETLLNAAGITLTFTATCDIRLQPMKLLVELPQQLTKAVMYPERIGAIKKDDQGHTAIVVVGGSAGVKLDALNGQESAVIEIGLVTADEADQLRKDKAAKNAEEAAKAALAAAASAAASTAAPGRAP